VEFRYAWHAELHLMARLAGMRLQDRWAGWKREPFTAVSPGHVSVYEKPGARQPYPLCRDRVVFVIEPERSWARAFG
jgi:hypothetical protein